MSYYLRVESVNLSYFIDDTNDLSTTRGGSLLLLEAMDKVEKIIEDTIPEKAKIDDKKIVQLEEELKILRSAKSNKTNRKKIKRKESEIESAKNVDSTPTITKGASWGLFNLDTSEDIAWQIKNKIIHFFNAASDYQHATFVVDLLINSNQYPKDRDSLQTLNHWQQMQTPSLAVCREGTSSCAIDKVRPANEQQYLKDKTQDFVSNSVYVRRDYGKKQKKEFYKKITADDISFTDNTMINAEFTQDLAELSKASNKDILNGKIAYIYIDGNGFGDIQRRSSTPEVQREFDIKSRKGREALFTDMLKQIMGKNDWKTDEGKIRFETLLWGGDEVIWIVPAWQAWWVINQFYILAKSHITHNGESLFHATGLVFCHHDAPIHRVKALAGDLAEIGKEVCRNKNYIAYQVLESFDHVGMQLNNYRNEQVDKLGTWKHLLIDADNIDAIQSEVLKLKEDDDFAQRKIYQILHAYKNDKKDKAEHYFDKLSDTHKASIEKLQELFGGEHAHWLHLVDLWNYMHTGTE